MMERRSHECCSILGQYEEEVEAVCAGQMKQGGESRENVEILRCRENAQ